MQILFCDTEFSLRLVYYVKVILYALQFIIPLGLIIRVTVDLFKGILSGNDEKGEIFRKSIHRIVAAVIIFLVPTLVGAVLSIFNDYSNSSSYQDSFYNCYKQVSPELIEAAKNNNQE